MTISACRQDKFFVLVFQVFVECSGIISFRSSRMRLVLNEPFKPKSWYLVFFFSFFRVFVKTLLYNFFSTEFELNWYFKLIFSTCFCRFNLLSSFHKCFINSAEKRICCFVFSLVYPRVCPEIHKLAEQVDFLQGPSQRHWPDCHLALLHHSLSHCFWQPSQQCPDSRKSRPVVPGSPHYEGSQTSQTFHWAAVSGVHSQTKL